MVMAHEIGHTLGLEHSPVRHALMSPYYRKLGRSLVMSWDDILAVQQLYGEMMFHTLGPAVARSVYAWITTTNVSLVFPLWSSEKFCMQKTVLSPSQKNMSFTEQRILPKM